MKPNFDDLKVRWADMLKKYFRADGQLDPDWVTETACPHCECADGVTQFILNGFNHKRCPVCDSLFVSPRLSDKALANLYSDDYYGDLYTNSMLPAFERRKAVIGANKYRQLTSLSGISTGRVLDIGAGIGEVTDVFKDHGWETHATEMNKAAVDWLRTRGHAQVFRGALDDFHTELEFDAVMAWGVVEHVVDPDYFLRRAHAMLRPGGVFVSEVPHGNCMLIDMTQKSGFDPRRILMGEQHIMLYSIKAYRELHERNGFRELHLQTNGLDIDTIIRETGSLLPDDTLRAMQECVDSRQYGDLLRGFWVK